MPQSTELTAAQLALFFFSPARMYVGVGPASDSIAFDTMSQAVPSRFPQSLECVQHRWDQYPKRDVPTDRLFYLRDGRLGCLLLDISCSPRACVLEMGNVVDRLPPKSLQQDGNYL